MSFRRIFPVLFQNPADHKSVSLQGVRPPGPRHSRSTRCVLKQDEVFAERAFQNSRQSRSVLPNGRVESSAIPTKGTFDWSIESWNRTASVDLPAHHPIDQR